MSEKKKLTAPHMVEAVVKRVGHAPKVQMIPNTWAALESLVDGPLEIHDYDEKNVIIGNDEGCFLGREENVLGFYGTVVILGKGGNNRPYVSVDNPKAVCQELRKAAPDDIL